MESGTIDGMFWHLGSMTAFGGYFVINCTSNNVSPHAAFCCFAACCEICEFLLKYLLSIFRQTSHITLPKCVSGGRERWRWVIEFPSCLWATDSDSFMCIDQKAVQWFQITARNRKNLSSAQLRLRLVEVKGPLWASHPPPAHISLGPHKKTTSGGHIVTKTMPDYMSYEL